MPTVLMIKGFRFFFYAEEGNEPVHVHVAKGDGEGKICNYSAAINSFLMNF